LAVPAAGAVVSTFLVLSGRGTIASPRALTLGNKETSNNPIIPERANRKEGLLNMATWTSW
jgi:hypothetical protein